MKKLAFIFALVTLLLISLALAYVGFTAIPPSVAKPPPKSAFEDDWVGLMLSVTKSFGVSRTYYIGSDHEWAYFETKGEGLFTPTFRKVRPSLMKLRCTYPFCKGKPYQIEWNDFVNDRYNRNPPGPQSQK